VTESLQEPTLSVGEMKHTTDVYLVERIEKGMVDGLTIARILQGPADLWAASFDLKVRILASQEQTPENLR